MPKEIKIDRTMHCECGNDTYQVKWGLGPDGVVTRVVCAECGRRTRALDPSARK